MVGSAAKAGTLQWDDSQRARRGSNARRGSKDIPQLKTRPGSGDNVRPVFADNGKDITPKVGFNENLCGRLTILVINTFC